LDAAAEAGIPTGGWCPQGRLAEDGLIPAHYPLQETPTAEYAQRTEWNVRDADGTLLLVWAEAVTAGTAYTLTCARRLGKPHLIVQLEAATSHALASDWVRRHQISILNVAGPRESTSPGIYEAALRWLTALFRQPA
jgi:hypothetical protein